MIVMNWRKESGNRLCPQKIHHRIEFADCKRRRAMMTTIEIIGKTSGSLKWVIGMIINHEAGGFAYVKDCSDIGFFPS